MSKAKNKTTEQNADLIEETSPSDAPEKKTCFIIMPIADHPSYDNGHFNRVYDHLIKPACENAGYQAIRADDSKASHMIMFDILKKIVQCDMAICDLSTKNANVFYELGLRQAFNKKTILITDGKEKAPFDISGFRYVQYSPALRVDQCVQDINKITDMLNETTTASENDVNSIVKLLEIDPATVDTTQLNNEDSLIFKMMMNINDRLDKLSNSQKNEESRLHLSTESYGKTYFSSSKNNISLSDVLRNPELNPFEFEYTLNEEKLGKFYKIDEQYVYFRISGPIRKISRKGNVLDEIKVTSLLF
ncbi:hypothetical protein [Morganella morganii]|uniref:hypothetical protein n=1 Tax=Morganella morganii TaxID=582 RepID=UPI000922DED5|nr:hypothetical protein [Morganella morganii]SHL76063.1 hypothetical protein SAMN05216301_1102 [Morganella morganii]